MQMPKVIKSWLRQRAADKVVTIGEVLRIVNNHLARCTDDDPDYPYLLEYRNRLDARRDRLLTYLKETA